MSSIFLNPIVIGIAVFTVSGAAAKSSQVSKYESPDGTWTRESINAQLGPSFEALNPGAREDRPTLFKQPSRSCTGGFANRVNPYELGDHCFPDNDYWSESGQVAYAPDDPTKDPGLDRIQVFAYYDHVFALSPRLDLASGNPHPDPQTREENYTKLLGHSPREPVALVRNYGMLQNEALVIYRGGLLAVAGTQTSRADTERPYPGLLLPANKVPSALAVTTENEFALITVTDTDTGQGQIAVVALEGKYIPYHTWPYMGLVNQGSFSDFKLLGYVDLPMGKPTAIASASNGWWNGPSQTNNQVLSQVKLDDEGTRQGILKGELGWQSIVATKGYAVVASREENKAVFVDLSPLIQYVRESYLASAESFQRTVKQRGSGPRDWPVVFTENPSARPKVVLKVELQRPTSVLAGMQIDRWEGDHHKAYVACEDGTIHIFDASSLIARWDWEGNAPLAELGTVKVGRNPVSMVFTRFGDYPLPFLPKWPDGKPMQPEPLNNTFYVACRGDREIDAVVVWKGAGQVYRKIKDQRMGDPVAVSVATRGNIVSVADFHGRKILSFRIGPITGRYGEFYGAGEDGKADFEFAGELPIAGHPFLLNSANVN